MPNFNPYVPGSYPSYIQPMQQAYQMQQPMQPAPQMTLPTIHADIIQAGSIDEIRQSNVGAGTSQMFILKDESAIIIKTAQANGYTLDIYDKRPPAPQAPAFDPAVYVTREELEERLSALTPRRTKKEAVEE